MGKRHDRFIWCGILARSQDPRSITLTIDPRGTLERALRAFTEDLGDGYVADLIRESETRSDQTVWSEDDESLSRHVACSLDHMRSKRFAPLQPVRFDIRPFIHIVTGGEAFIEHAAAGLAHCGWPDAVARCVLRHVHMLRPDRTMMYVDFPHRACTVWRDLETFVEKSAHRQKTYSPAACDLSAL